MPSRFVLAVASMIILFVAALAALVAPSFARLPQAPYSQDATPTLDPFPRPNSFDIVVAEQVFEGGRMFYLQPVDRIWVLFYDGESRDTGTWAVYENVWTEGMPETDTTIIPPDGYIQPKRGFGVLWREDEDLRAKLGFALDPEIGFESHYTFTEGAVSVVDGVVTVEAGVHTLTSYYGAIFTFDEPSMSWTREVIEPVAEMTIEPTAEVTPES
ncbi:MAG TPA: hypothetical protein PLZ51_16805 [Aggregatilineales bacterium]|nr:hypothetical protein [Aggregatilineales bacterium]